MGSIIARIAKESLDSSVGRLEATPVSRWLKGRTCARLWIPQRTLCCFLSGPCRLGQPLSQDNGYILCGPTNLGCGQLEERIRQEIAILGIQRDIFATLQFFCPCAKIFCAQLSGPELVEGMSDIPCKSSG